MLHLRRSVWCHKKMSQYGEVHVSAEPVKAQCEACARKTEEFIENLIQVQGQLQEQAKLCYDTGAPDKVTQLRAGMVDLGKLEHEARTYLQAMNDEVGQKYQAPELEATDFEQLLKEATNTRLKRAKYNPKESEQLKGFDKETGGGGEGEEDDDDVVAADNSVLVNKKCPYTMKNVLELDYPMEDQLGYVYEKAAIMQYVKQARGGSVKCPVAGTNHMITAADLRPSDRVRREKRRQMFQATQAGPSQGAQTQSTQGDAHVVEGSQDEL